MVFKDKILILKCVYGNISKTTPRRRFSKYYLKEKYDLFIPSSLEL